MFHFKLQPTVGAKRSCYVCNIRSNCGKCKITSGPVLDKPGDLAGLLTNLV
ncbi:MAG: hypothetical protein ACK5MD_08385 [Flavobacteriales bacterium]